MLWWYLGQNYKAHTLYHKLFKDDIPCGSTRMVRLHNLYCTQSHVDGDAVAEYVAHPRKLSVDQHGCVADLSTVVRYRGRDFAIDGHHRLIAKMIRGVMRVEVYFWDLDAMLATP